MIDFISNKKNHTLIFLLIFLLCTILLFFRFYITRSVMGGDAVYYYSNIRSLLIDKDIDFRNEYTHFYNEISPFTGNRKIPSIPVKNSTTGKLPNIAPIGSAVLLAPFFVIGHFFSNIFQNLGFSVSTDGYSSVCMIVVAFGSLLYAFIGMFFIYCFGKKLFDENVALLGAVGIWLCTPIIYYMTMEPLMSHTISMFGVTAFVFYWYLTRENRKIHQWILLGLIGGGISIVRYQDASFLIIPIMEITASQLFRKMSWKIVCSYVRAICAFLIAAISIIALQLYANKVLYGSPFTTGYAGYGFIYWKSPRLFYTLFSTQCGLLLWSPIVIFSIVGFFLFSKKNPLIGSLLAGSFFIQWYIVSSWFAPSQGDSFGNRMLLNCSIVFAIGLMHFLYYIKSVRDKYYTYAIISLGGLILLNGILSGLYCFRIIGNPY